MSSVPPAFGPKLLLVDDDAMARRGVAGMLRALGYAATEATNGRECLARVAERAPDLILLDIEMPELDGWGTLAELRAQRFAGAVIVLTAADSTDDAVRALTAGADDFLTKPCDLRELAARVHAVLRRLQPPQAHATLLQFGEVRIDLAARAAEVHGAPLPLTRTEFKLLEVLASDPGRSLTRQELLEKVWRYASSASSRTVDTHVWRLRQKIAAAPPHAQCILTTPDGYRLAASVVANAPAVAAAGDAVQPT